MTRQRPLTPVGTVARALLVVSLGLVLWGALTANAAQWVLAAAATGCAAISIRQSH